MPVKLISSVPQYAPVDLDSEVSRLADTTLTKVRPYGQTLRLGLERAITQADIGGTIEGAPTFTLTVHDPEGELLDTPGFVNNKFDLEVDGAWYRLVGVDKRGDDLELTFEDRVIAWMRMYADPVKAYRDEMTRAEFFVQRLLGEIVEGTIRVYCPELRTVLPIRQTTATRGLPGSGSVLSAGALKWDYTGQASWYGGPNDSGDNNQPYTGIPNTIPGVAFENGHVFTVSKEWSKIVWVVVRAENGRAAAFPITDKGPSTGKIDFNYTALKTLGYPSTRAFEAVQERQFRVMLVGQGDAGMRRAKALAGGIAPPRSENKRKARQSTVRRDDVRATGLAEAEPVADPTAIGGSGQSLTVKGSPARPDQIKVGNTCLGIAEELNAPYRARVAMIETLIVENTMTNNAGGDGSSNGAFQLIASTARGMGINAMDLEACCRAFLTRGFYGKGGAIKLANTTKLSSGAIAQACQGSAYPARYAQYQREAIKWVQSYSGGSGTSGGGTAGTDADQGTLKQTVRYAFQRGKDGTDENTWQCGLRLFREIGWRLFVVRNVVFVVSEEYLFKSRPRMAIAPDTESVLGIDFAMIMGHKSVKDPAKNASVAEMTVPCRIDRWQAPEGTMVQVKRTGPANGLWLVTARNRSLFSRNGQITLKKPLKALPEPTPEVKEKQIGSAGSPGSADGGSGASAGSGALGRLTGASLAGTQPQMVEFGRAVAGQLGQTITVNSAKRNGGGASNHDRGAALDLGVGGDARSSQAAGQLGNRICAAAMIVCGMDPDKARENARQSDTPPHNFGQNMTWRGRSVEMGWRTFVGGNHYNHVHVGFDR